MCGTLARYVRGVNSMAEDNKSSPTSPIFAREREEVQETPCLRITESLSLIYKGITHTTPLPLGEGQGGGAACCGDWLLFYSFFFPNFPCLSIFFYIFANEQGKTITQPKHFK